MNIEKFGGGRGNWSQEDKDRILREKEELQTENRKRRANELGQDYDEMFPSENKN